MINHRAMNKGNGKKFYFTNFMLTLCLFINNNKFKLLTGNIITPQYIMFTLESINSSMLTINAALSRKQCELPLEPHRVC